LSQERKENAVTIVRVGTSKKYSDGWEGAFGKRSSGKSAVKAKRHSAAQKAKKRVAAKKSKK
jgi:hypothetical protein